ncbi:MAG: nucleotidyltransferase domain-containing protein [Planctomycetes bacterium]|nr:nucleotidyltransferase domain-containing protein [Planctomycetota bacterium]
MIALREIRAFARRIAAEFKPRRIILFGSYAYGTPTEDSDVDLMVVFAGHESAIDRSLEIRLKLPYPGFPMDLLARSEGEMRRRYKLEDWFIREVVDRGIVVYEANHAQVGRKNGSRLSNGRARTAAKVGFTL